MATYWTVDLQQPLYPCGAFYFRGGWQGMTDGMDEGYVKLWRKSIESAVFKNANLWMFWSWCLMKATHKPFTTIIGYQKIDLLPGQFIFGRRKAAEELPLSERKIRTCIKTLLELQNMTIKTTNKFSIITICNWQLYQNQDNQNDQHIDQQTTNKRPTNDHIQEHKEHKEVEENTLVPVSKNQKPVRFDSDDMRLALLLSELMTHNNPSRKLETEAQLNNWANTCRLMRKKDNRTVMEIEERIRFSQNDCFWKINILSMDTVRKRFDRLTLQMKANKSPRIKQLDVFQNAPVEKCGITVDGKEVPLRED